MNFLYRYAAPQNFYVLAGRIIPWAAILAFLLFLVGAYVGFFLAPTDAQQGEGYRIIFPACARVLDVHADLSGHGFLVLDLPGFSIVVPPP